MYTDLPECRLSNPEIYLRNSILLKVCVVRSNDPAHTKLFDNFSFTGTKGDYMVCGTVRSIRGKVVTCRLPGT